jgi:hypothetical protein
VLRLFLDPRPVPMLFVAATILFSIISNALYDSLKTVLPAPLAVTLVAVGLLVVFVGVTFLLRRLFHPQVVTDAIEPRRALIVLVSQGELEKIPATEAIKFHHSPRQGQPGLEFCWLLRTSAPNQEPQAPARSSWMNAQILEEMYRGKVRMFLKTVEVDDPESVSMAVAQAHQEARRLAISDSEMVADITGGTKMMSIGVALASLAAGIDMTYLWARKTLVDGRADPASGVEPRRVNIDYFRRSAAGE